MVSDEETLAVFRKYPMRNINWLNLSCSTDEARLRLLKNPHHINWNLLTMNKSFAVSILRENQDKIRWHYLSSTRTRRSSCCGKTRQNQLGQAVEQPLRRRRETSARKPKKISWVALSETPLEKR
jgi:hypothetical protein